MSSSHSTGVSPTRVDLQARIIAELSEIGDIQHIEGHITDLGGGLFFFDSVAALLLVPSSSSPVRVTVSWDSENRSLIYSNVSGGMIDVSRDRWPSLSPEADEKLATEVLQRAAEKYHQAASDRTPQRGGSLGAEDLAVGFVANLVVAGLLIAVWMMTGMDPERGHLFFTLSLISLVAAPLVGMFLRRAFRSGTGRLLVREQKMPSGRSLLFSSFVDDVQRRRFFEVVADHCIRHQVEMCGNPEVALPISGDRAMMSFVGKRGAEQINILFDGKSLLVRDGESLAAL